jgi:hypothetical protein
MTTEETRPAGAGTGTDGGAASDSLAAALRALPRETAGAGFTARTLARLDRAPAAARRLPPLAVAAAASLASLGLGALVWALVASGQVAGLPDRPGSEPPRRARLEALETERALLAAELEEIRRLAAEPTPVLYLGGDDEIDLVLDLGRLAQQRLPDQPRERFPEEPRERHRPTH